MKKRELETELFYLGLIFLAVGIVSGSLYLYLVNKFLPPMPCIFWTVVGIYCPGCGGTRAVIALAEGKILLSLWYHPLVLYFVVIFGGFMITQGLHRLGIACVKGWKFHNWYLYGAIVLVVCNFLIKNLLLIVWGITM